MEWHRPAKIGISTWIYVGIDNGIGLFKRKSCRYIRGGMAVEKLEYINLDDPAIPWGKRKAHYVKWLMHAKGYSLEEAKLQSWKKFGNNPYQRR